MLSLQLTLQQNVFADS